MTLFRKSYATAAAATVAGRRTTWLRAGGIRTPEARPGRGPKDLLFDYIAGASRFELIAVVPISALLAPLAALHDVPAKAVPSFDPLLRIRPRRTADDPGWLTAALDQLGSEEIGGTTLLHGDFHVGQLIRDEAGDMWLVDLDDLAIGPPEADLGNFIAHLSSSAETARSNFADSLAFWQREVLGGWAALGRGCDPKWIDRYLRLALIRRHLKLRAAGRPDYGAALAQYLSAP